MRIDGANNRVGIGTTAPAHELHISSSDYATFAIQGQTTHGAEIMLGDGTDIDYGTIVQFGAGSGEGGRMRFIAGTTETMNLRGGNVGIGTAAPGAILHIEDAVDGDMPIRLLNTGGGAGSTNESVSIQFWLQNGAGGSSGVSSIKVGKDSDHASAAAVDDFMSFSTVLNDSAAERMRITSAGNVGIGISTLEANGGTTARLQVEGTGADDSSVSLFRNTNNAFGPYLTLGKSRGGAVNADTIVADNDVIGTIYWTGADGSDRSPVGAKIFARINGTPGSNDTPTELVFATTPDGAADSTERMYISSAGNVGIGIADPAYILDCKSSATVGKFYRTSSGTGANASVHFASDVGGTDTIVCTIRNDGDLENTNNSYGALSDRNVKSYISDSRGYLADINKLKVKKFKFNSHIVQENAGTGSAEWRLGLIAQDVEEVFPGLVTSGSYDGDNTMYSGSAENDTITKVTGSEAIKKSVKHSIVNTMLIKAVQELTTEIKFLRASITGSTDINQLKALVSGSTFV
jgi:hypothetical protein